MNRRFVTGKYVRQFAYATLVVASLAPSLACAVDAQPTEQTANQSEPQVTGAKATGDVVGRIVKPAEAVQFPRSVALQNARRIMVVSHDDVTALSSGVTRSAQ